MKTITATTARNTFFNIIKESTKCHMEYHITSRSGEVAMMSWADYESLMETLYLLSSPDFIEKHKSARQDIAKGNTYSLEDVFQ